MIVLRNKEFTEGLDEVSKSKLNEKFNVLDKVKSKVKEGVGKITSDKEILDKVNNKIDNIDKTCRTKYEEDAKIAQDVRVKEAESEAKRKAEENLRKLKKAKNIRLAKRSLLGLTVAGGTLYAGNKLINKK